MVDQFVLRSAVDADSIALSQLRQQTFLETFVEDFAIPYPEHDLKSYFRLSASPEAVASKIADPQLATWVIEDKTSNELVAFAMAGPCELPHPDICPGEDGELRYLFVRRDQRARGHGKRLMNVALTWLQERYTKRPVWISVWSGNLKAQKFYMAYGFNTVGDYSFHVGEWKDHEFIMRRKAHLM
ncbi:unnamed protein product [Adineta steineri]|uniref:N-acetyltransferase domain-containing protein n=1 Tax=Adineta steineri TaxID=433720 RepID=A0A814BX12_9BILA|nr:unnamed protein product [Adineta steineri]